MRNDLILRALSLAELLKQRRHVHINELSRELGISQRTTYRWLQAASLELPIRLERGVVIWSGK